MVLVNLPDKSIKFFVHFGQWALRSITGNKKLLLTPSFFVIFSQFESVRGARGEHKLVHHGFCAKRAVAFVFRVRFCGCGQLSWRPVGLWKQKDREFVETFE